jgi:uncharacterized membrane protein YbhN (UPF0104 family)
VLVVVTGVSLYMLLPSLVAVFASWRSLSHLTWYWTVLALASEAVSFVFLAGVDAQDALLATFTYRLVSYWLPIPAGGAAYVTFRRRYP